MVDAMETRAESARRDRAWRVVWSSGAVVWAVVMVYLALKPEPTHLAGSPRLSHIAAFASLAFLACTATWRPGSRTRPAFVGMAGVLASLFLFGVGIEVAQALVGDSRYASLRDVYTNGAGILAGYGAWAMWWISWTPRAGP